MKHARSVVLMWWMAAAAGAAAAEAPSPHPPGAFPPPARADRHWSLEARRDPKPPAVRDETWSRNAIDRFVLARLEAAELTPAPDADRRTLVRRLSYDLLGLPPSPETIEAFVNDRSADAHDRLVDRLLASPHYGERWGRHWLDLVRYADTAGDNSDYPIPEAHRYRDYVIDAFNRDKPYDRFILEQIAGDRLTHEDQARRREQIIATGYIAMARRFGSVFRDYPQHLTIEDTIDNLGKTFLGLSLACARCHDHKFDPITREDYYGLYGIFASTRYAFPGIELNKVPADFVPLIPDAQLERLEKAYRARVDPLKRKARELRDALKEQERRLKQIARDRQPEAWEAQSKKVEAVKNKWREAQKRYDQAARAHRPDYPRAYGVIDGTIADARIHVMGDPKKTGPPVPRGFPSALGGGVIDVKAAKRASGRLELARWIADPDHPLTARVMVNRIWQYHFGKGLVRTSSDFGTRGLPPTHPRLLDWLAERFVESGWSVKAMHRLILTSRTYRLASRGPAENTAVDPENKLWWRANVRRLDAESLRDTLLSLAGRLDLAPLRQPHPFPPVEKWGFTQHHPFKAVYNHDKRSVYLMTRRLKRLPLFATFDGADRNAGTPVRTAATTPVQALFVMNDPFMHEMAAAFAARLRGEAPDDGARIDRAYRLAFGRPASADELKDGAAYLKRAAALTNGDVAAAWSSYARALLQANALMYVE